MTRYSMENTLYLKNIKLGLFAYYVLKMNRKYITHVFK